MTSVDKSSDPEHLELARPEEEVVIDTRPIAVVLLSKSVRPVILIFGALLFAVLLRATPPAGLSEAAERAIAVFALAAFYWITGVLPLMVTSLLVIVLLGISGVMPPRAAYALFGNESMFFILAAFMLAAAVSHRGLGRRVAIEVFGRFGTTPQRLVLSIYLFSALMSFLIPEHAVAAIVFPLVLDIVGVMELRPGDSRYATALFLAMAWGVNIGGIATLLGGARAPLALGILAETTGHSISFLQWTAATLPLVGLLLAAGYLVITLWFAPDLQSIAKVTSDLRRRRSALGRMTLEEIAVALVLGLTVLAWLLGSHRYGYAGIGILAVVALFVLNLLTWHEVEDYVNWGIFLMYGGAIAMGSALEKTGAAQFIARVTAGSGKSPLLMLAFLTLASEVLGELLSHSAVVAALVPVGLGIARQFGLNPSSLTMSVAVPAGLTFILPVGTPSIALAYSSGYLRRKDLLMPGALMIVIAWIGLNVMIRVYWPLIGLGVMTPH